MLLAVNDTLCDFCTELNGESEWSDGTRSDALYIPKNEVLQHASIIIEVKHTVNLVFINRAIGYCTSAYHRFKTLPVLFVFCINAATSIPPKLFTSSTLPCAQDITCDLWARIVILSAMHLPTNGLDQIYTHA